jgi:uncharacterized membrane protein YoaK (UPF0700 family)
LLARVQTEVRWPIALAAALTFGTGAIDITMLTRLGGVFASVITGNLVLTGLAFANANSALVAYTATAVGGFIVGVAVGSRVTGARVPDGPRWPLRVTVALGVELVALTGFTVGWEATGASPTGSAQLALLAIAAIGMGLQSAAARGLGVTVATTYLTGTLTSVIAGLTGSARSRTNFAGVAALIAAVGGAVCGGVALSSVPALAPLLTLVPLAVVLVAATQYHLRAARGSRSGPPSCEPALEPAR